MKKTCISCNRYLSCLKPEKGASFRCEDFKSIKIALADIGISAEEAEALEEDTFQHFSVQAMVMGATQTDSLIAPDVKVPDGDFPLAPNFTTWCEGSQYLNIVPYVMQAVMGTILFADYCPRCSDTQWLLEDVKGTESMRVFHKKVALYEHGKCPHCGMNRTKAKRKGVQKIFDEFIGIAGQRSGKSAFIGQGSTYCSHRLIKMQNPNKVYGLLNSNILHSTFVSLTFGQAKENLWDPYYGLTLDSPWFQDYHTFLSELGHRQGVEYFKFNDTFVDYKHRKFRVYPAAPDMRVLRGRTRGGVSAIDEICYFDNEAASRKIRVNGPEIYKALNNSLRTVRGKAAKLLARGYHDILSAYFMNISSPFSERDLGMSLLRKSETSDHLYGLHRPTWRMNPDITRESLKDDFMKDPVGAMRDFGAQPPITANQFVSQEDSIEKALNGERNKLILQFKTRTTELNKDQIRRGVPARRMYAVIDKIKSVRNPTVFAIDAGFSNNSFAGALMSKDLETGKHIVHLLMEVPPRMDIPIHYRLLYDHLLKRIMEKCNTKLFAADRWNSLKVLSDAEIDVEDLVSIQYSLKYSDMLMVRDRLYAEDLVLPSLPKGVTFESIRKVDLSNYPHCFKNDPASHLALQLMTVRDTGKSVEKGDSLTDDLWRAVALGSTMLEDDRFEDLWNLPLGQVERAMRDVRQMAIARGYSGGQGGGATIGGSSSGMSSSGRALGKLLGYSSGKS